MVYFIADPHLGHRNIARYRAFVSSEQDNTAQFKDYWTQKIGKNDVVYVLGDAAFDLTSLNIIGNLKGRKILIKGNHDDFVSTSHQLNVFEEIHGMLKYKGMWLTHAPIHPAELRGKPNIHGHVHSATIMKEGFFGRKSIDKRYLNACVDVVYPKYGSWFVSLDQAKQYFGI